MEFYKANKSLKLLVGSQVLVRSQSARNKARVEVGEERQSEAGEREGDGEVGMVETVVVKRKKKSKASVK